jgi:hypothetical protein
MAPIVGATAGVATTRPPQLLRMVPGGDAGTCFPGSPACRQRHQANGNLTEDPMNGAILIRWGASIPSREAAGLNVFGKTVARFEELAKSGRVHGHQEYFSVTGRNGGFMMIDGELDELMKILVEDETMKLTDQASAVVSDLEIQAFAGGNDRATQQLVTDYTTNLQEIGYM